MDEKTYDHKTNTRNRHSMLQAIQLRHQRMASYLATRREKVYGGVRRQAEHGITMAEG